MKALNNLVWGFTDASPHTNAIGVGASSWKKLRVTAHDHNPVHDAMGNLEAFERMLNGER